MRRTTLRAIAPLAVFAIVASSIAHPRAQERAVVFIHGVASSPDTWSATASRLQSELQIVPGLPRVSWQNSLESQGDEVQRQVGGFPGSTIAVGHSLGGVVGRQWRRQDAVGGILTRGPTEWGAPIPDNLHGWGG